MVAMGTLIYALLWFVHRRENKRRELGIMDEKYQGLDEDELMELGDESPAYRYTL